MPVQGIQRNTSQKFLILVLRRKCFSSLNTFLVCKERDFNEFSKTERETVSFHLLEGNVVIVT